MVGEGDEKKFAGKIPREGSTRRGPMLAMLAMLGYAKNCLLFPLLRSRS